MPLIIEGQRIEAECCKDYQQALKCLEPLKVMNESVLSVAPLPVDNARLLYVSQREYAVVLPDDDAIDFVGTDDATTCHIIILRHTGSGAVCVSHLDGWKTKHCVEQLLKAITAAGKPDGRIEACICGGFVDPKNHSKELSCELLEALALSTVDVHLKLACITDFNDTIQNNVHFPVIYGMGVNVKEFSIFRAKFSDKGPDENLRSAAIFGSSKKFDNIYNEQHELVIGPYTWRAWDQIQDWIAAPAYLILKHLSTSPEQEPEGYVEHVRGSLSAIAQHPHPLQTLFKDGPRRYKKNAHGEWVLIQ